jgi:hypothetical protein
MTATKRSFWVPVRERKTNSTFVHGPYDTREQANAAYRECTLDSDSVEAAAPISSESKDAAERWAADYFRRNKP